MAALHIAHAVIAFALTGLALCPSFGLGQEQGPRHEQARKSTTPPAPGSVVVSFVDHVPAALQPLVLLPVNGGDTVVLVPQHDDGGFSNDDLRRAAVAFSQQSPGKVHSLAPRLLDLVYRSMRHFEASVVRVVSGYRRDRAGSRHTQGRAVDMTIDGVANDRLAAFARKLGFVGVGFYPKSGFVHLDVRDASYFWIYDSAPGAPNHLLPVREDEARNADESARARGEAPDVYVPNNLKEDVAAAKVYARRARLRREAARH